MGKYKGIPDNQTLFMGIDVHRFTWYITVLTIDSEEVFHGGIRDDLYELEKLLKRFKRNWRRMNGIGSGKTVCPPL